MKRFCLYFLILLTAAACTKKPETPVNLDEVFAIEQPTPKTALTRVALNETQKGYVREGNKLSFKFLKQLTEENKGSFICSPLSLQLALAMTANGAQGETLQEMLDVLGYGQEGMAALNAYARILIEQLPAVDLDVTLKMADALLAADKYPLNATFRETLRAYYYAPAASMSFDNPQPVLAQVNEWARRNTEGLIDPILKEMSPNAVAYLMNALYFKAKWKGSETNPMFTEQATYRDTFYHEDGSTKMVSYMNTSRVLPYVDKGEFVMVALPYASGKFFLYILLPKALDGGLDDLVTWLAGTSWNELISSFRDDVEVRLRLPRFETSGDFELNKTLQSLGMRRAFDEVNAQFGGMFDGANPGFYISRVLQKAKISVAEWGTEAAAVTVVEMGEKSAAPGPSVRVDVNRPFVFVLGEQESGTILFEGVYKGE